LAVLHSSLIGGSKRHTRPPLVVLGLLAVLLAGGCASGGGEYLDLEGYDPEDLEPFRALWVEDELSEHPELAGRTVYHLAFEIGETGELIRAEARIRFTNRDAAPIREIPFFLYPNLTPGGLEVFLLQVDGREVKPLLADRRSRLVVRLPQMLEAEHSVSVRMGYELTVPVSERGEYGGFGISGNVLSLAYAYPMIPAREGWEHPLPVPYGDFVFNDASFYLVQVTMPQRMILAAPGVELGHREAEGRREVVFAMGPARDLYLALSPEFEVHSERIGETLVRSFAAREVEAGSRSALAAATAALSGFTQRFEPYPYTTFTVVSVPLSALGLEFPGIIIDARRLYVPGRDYGGVPAPVLLEATTAHEVAHQWFYGAVGNDQLLEPWLDEALAQYATWLYYKDRYGESGARGFFESWYGRWDRVGRVEIPIGKPVGSYTPGQYGAIVYGRGPLFIKALSEQMGREVFAEFLREYTRRFEWGRVDTPAFQAAAETACGCRLEQLFAHWVGAEQTE